MNISDTTNELMKQAQGIATALAEALRNEADDLMTIAGERFDDESDEHEEAEELADEIREGAQESESLADLLGELIQ